MSAAHSAASSPALQSTSASQPRGRGALAPLLIFAALYLSALTTATSVAWAAGCALVAVLVAVISWRLGAAQHRVPTVARRRAVGVTAALEGVVLVVAVIVAVVTGIWWPVLPAVLSAVAVHFLALDVAFGRAVDHWSLGCMAAASVAAWLFSRTAMPWVWPLTAAIAAGTCLGYAGALVAARSQRPGRSSGHEVNP